jgi:undecaprenyl-diphosphatase
MSEEIRTPVDRPTLYARWLSPEGYLGAHLVVGFVVMLAAGFAFVEISEEVFESTTTLAVDAWAQSAAARIATPALTSAVVAITTLGNSPVLTVLSIAVAVWLGLAHSKRRLVAFVATMAGGSLMNLALKAFFRRERPFEVSHLTHADGFSFPSGHSMGAMLFFGSLAYVLYFTLEVHRVWRIAAVVLCVLATVAIGLSRVYLGVHYLSDVVAGWIAALCWIAVCLTGTEAWIKWRDWRRGRRLAPEEQ